MKWSYGGMIAVGAPGGGVARAVARVVGQAVTGAVTERRLALRRG